MGVTCCLQSALLLQRHRYQVSGVGCGALQLALQALQDAQLCMRSIKLLQSVRQALAQVTVGALQQGKRDGGGSGGTPSADSSWLAP